MTTPPSLVQRAQQGDAVAIAVLMNDVLQAQDVWVKATLESDCLQVMLKAPTALHQARCIAFIRRGLVRLQPTSINQVIAYAWRVGDVFPLWVAAFSLEPTLLPQHPLNASATAVMEERSPADPITLSGNTPSPNKPAVPSAQPTSLSSHALKQRTELLKLGFVIMLTTVVYFVVTGV